MATSRVRPASSSWLRISPAIRLKLLQLELRHGSVEPHRPHLAAGRGNRLGRYRDPGCDLARRRVHPSRGGSAHPDPAGARAQLVDALAPDETGPGTAPDHVARD